MTVGRLDQQKDHATLIHVFARFYSTYPHLTLTIYGEGDEQGSLQNLINSLNLQEKYPYRVQYRRFIKSLPRPIYLCSLHYTRAFPML
jgi:glycosyltransferase involved in cell wall biosynthesis